MNQQEITKRQEVVTRHENYGRMLLSIAHENGISATLEPYITGRWQVEILCSANCINRLNAETVKSLLPESANWELDDAPNSGDTPFVDVFNPADDADGPPLARLFLKK